MTTARTRLIEQIWGGIDPFENKSAFAGREDYQGWASEHFYLARAIETCAPAVVVEVGVWKGGSVITMGHKIQAMDLDAVIIAIDTWLGAADHWYQPEWISHLRFENGYPSLFKTFSANILGRDLQNVVVPLPLDSLNAAVVLEHHHIRPDVLHIDGGHDYQSVTADLRTWWPKLNVGGVLIGDDYHPKGVDVWPEVRAAFQDFFQSTEIENIGGKCFIQKACGSLERVS